MNEGDYAAAATIDDAELETIELELLTTPSLSLDDPECEWWKCGMGKDFNNDRALESR